VGDQELVATTEEGQFMGRIALDRLEQPIEVQSRDEIGELAVAFNAMKEQLRQFLITLEERVLERTRALETSASVSRQLTIILDISELLQQVVTLIKETFNYYHVHIYLLDESGEILEMAEGYGQAGAEMKRQRHHILLSAPKSLVARAARERQIITVENVRADPTWLPNPLLPDTHSEMAVPVVLEDQVVGVLDVQSEKVGGLTQEDEAALGTLANQVAIAVRNVRLFTQTQQALEEAQKLQRLYTVQAWESLTARRPKTEYEVCQPTLPPLQEVATPEALIALQQKRTVALQPTADGPESKDADGGTAERLPETETPLIKDQNALATPLKVSDQIIGVLGIRDDDQQRQWTEEEIALIEAISEQMSLAMENARLFEETSRRAVREQMVRQITDKIRASRDIESALRTATRELGKALVVPRAVVDLKVAPETETDASDHSQD
jgi:GAF domain-containing protein